MTTFIHRARLASLLVRSSNKLDLLYHFWTLV